LKTFFKVALFLLIAVLLASPAFGTITAGACHTGATGHGTTITTPTCNLAAGSLVYVACSDFGATFTATPITDSVGGNAWNQVSTSQTTPGTARVSMWYSVLTNGGATMTVSCNYTAAIDADIGIQDFTGNPPAGNADGSNPGSGNSTSPSSGSMTPSATGDVIVGAKTHDGSPTTTVGTNFTSAFCNDGTTNAQPLCLEYHIKTDSAAEAATYTLSVANNWVVVGGMYRATALAPTISVSKRKKIEKLMALTDQRGLGGGYIAPGQIMNAAPGSTFPSGWSAGSAGQTLASIGSYPTDSNSCPFATNVGSTIYAWSGAALDSANNRMLIFGGGHTDGCENSIYAWTLNGVTGSTNFSRIFGPTVPTNWSGGTCPNSLAGGTVPNSKHSYSGLAVGGGYFTQFGGVPTCTAGGFGSDLWKYNLSGASWTKISDDISSGACSTCLPAGTAYDSDRNLLWVFDNRWLNKVNLATGVSNQENDSTGSLGQTTYTNMVYDPVDKILLVLGAANQFYYDTSSGHCGDGTAGCAQLNPKLSTSGPDSCSTVINAAAVGLTFNSKLGKIVAYPGTGQTIYIINWGTRGCSAVTYSGTGCSNNPHSGYPGIFGRFQYFPQLDVYACYTDENTSGFILNPN
jgi:hypothetical protein